MRNYIFLSLVIAALLNGCGTNSTKGSSDGSSPAETYIQLGLNYLSEGKRDQSRFNLLKAVDVDPRSPEAHNAIALLYQTEGEEALADQHYKKALSLENSFTQARNNYARFLLLNGRAAEAEEQYEIVTEDINYRLRAQAFLGLGLARKEQIDIPGAKDAFTRAYQRDPRTSLALLELADIAVLDSDYVTAQELLDQFESQSAAIPRSLKLGYELATLFADEDAKSSYSMSLRNMFPDSREAREHILSTQGAN